jgi:hypothetical protein
MHVKNGGISPVEWNRRGPILYMRNDSYTHFSQQPHNKLTWLVIFYYFFTKRKENKTKKNNKILPTTLACCGAIVRNECRDHFSLA